MNGYHSRATSNENDNNTNNNILIMIAFRIKKAIVSSRNNASNKSRE